MMRHKKGFERATTCNITTKQNTKLWSWPIANLRASRRRQAAAHQRHTHGRLSAVFSSYSSDDEETAARSAAHTQWYRQ